MGNHLDTKHGVYLASFEKYVSKENYWIITEEKQFMLFDWELCNFLFTQFHTG